MSKVRIYGELDLLDPTLQNEAKRICDERNALDLARCDELEMDLVEYAEICSMDAEYLNFLLSKETHFCLLGTGWYMECTCYDAKVEIDYLVSDGSETAFIRAREMKNAFSNLALLFPHHLFVVDIDEHDSSLLEFASQNKMIDIFKNDYMMPCEFVFSESFLSSIRGKTTPLVFTDFDALKIDEKKLPAGVHIFQGIDLKDKKMKSKKSAIAREYISKKGREAAWDTGLDDFSIRAFADSYFCMIADDWFIEYSVGLSVVRIEFWLSSKWTLSHILQMKRALFELLYTYRDKIFVGAFNEHSFAFLMKALNKGMISIVCDIKQIDDPFYDDYAFEVTPSFIEKYESKREKRMTMKPLDSHDKPI